MKIGLKDYKDVHFSRDIIILYSNRMLLQIAFGVVGIFFPIFFFLEFNYSFLTVALIYILVYTGHGLLTPIGAKLIKLFGMRRLMIISVPFALLGMGVMYFWEVNPISVLFTHILLITLYKVLYWVPYHVDFALFADRKARGRQLSVLLNISELVLVFTPLLGGFIIAVYGFQSIFIISTIIFLAAIPSLFLISSNPKEEYSYGYFETFKHLFKKENRPILLGYSADGAQATVSSVIWPIFIFLLLDEKFLTVGIVASLTLIVVIVFQLLVGDLIDRWSRKKVLTIGSILYSTGWIIKTFVETAFQIFLVDAYHNLGRTVSRVSIDTNTYIQSVDNGHYIDEFTALKEIALNLGRVLMLIFVIIVVSFATIKVTFIAAAITTLFITILNRQVAVT